MKTSNHLILVLSLLSFIFTMIAGFNILSDIAVIDKVGIGLLIVSATQVVIAIVSVWSGYDEKK